MKVTLLDERSFEVKFLKLKGSYLYGSERGRQKINTVCRIFQDGKFLSMGTARLSHLDRYDKRTGKKVALAKALKGQEGVSSIPVSFSKADRKMFWWAFHSEFCHIPKQ